MAREHIQALAEDIQSSLEQALTRAEKRGDTFSEEEFSVALLLPVSRIIEATGLEAPPQFAKALVMSTHVNMAEARAYLEAAIAQLRTEFRSHNEAAEALGAELLRGR